MFNHRPATQATYFLMLRYNCSMTVACLPVGSPAELNFLDFNSIA